MWAKGTPTKI